MSKIDVADVKRKILQILEKDGPTVPTPLAKKLGMQPMFASAILSELLNEKRVKTSSLKVGSSPLYLIPGQEEKLEAYTENLTGVEKEAYLKLKDNKFLEDTTQEPKIRVALRGLKDFAIPLQHNGKTFWKYFSVSNDKIKDALYDGQEVAIGERVVGQKIWEDIQKEQPKEEIKIQQPNPEAEKIVNVLVNEAEKTFTKEAIKEPLQVGKIQNEPIVLQESNVMKLANENKKLKKLTEKDLFLENVKRMLYGKNIEILETISYDKKQVIAKARVNVDQNCILFFLDKKRPDEKDLIKAYKKAKEYHLPYYIITQAEAPKKIKENLEVYRHLLGLDNLE